MERCLASALNVGSGHSPSPLRTQLRENKEHSAQRKIFFPDLDSQGKKLENRGKSVKVQHNPKLLSDSYLVCCLPPAFPVWDLVREC